MRMAFRKEDYCEAIHTVRVFMDSHDWDDENQRIQLRAGVAVSARVVPADAPRERHPAEHEQERKPLGQRCD